MESLPWRSASRPCRWQSPHPGDDLRRSSERGPRPGAGSFARAGRSLWGAISAIAADVAKIPQAQFCCACWRFLDEWTGLFRFKKRVVHRVGARPGAARLAIQVAGDRPRTAMSQNAGLCSGSHSAGKTILASKPTPDIGMLTMSYLNSLPHTDCHRIPPNLPLNDPQHRVLHP